MTLRDQILTELVRHGTGPSHPHACMCGLWDGTGTYAAHLLSCVLALAQTDGAGHG